MKPATARARLRVLLVEDNPADVNLARRSLPATSFEVEEFALLSEAVEATRRNRFDVALLDLSLPDQAGIDTLLRFREQVPQLPVVVLTGFNDEEMAGLAIGAGAQDYLIKGEFIPQLWGRAVKYAVQRFQAEQQLAQQARTLDTILDASADAIVMFDVAGRYIYLNRAAAQALELNTERLLGHTPRESGLSAEWCDRMETDLAKVYAERKAVSGECRLLLSFGPRFWDYVLSPICDAQSEVVSVVCTIRDVTERLNLESQLRESQKLESIGKLAGGVAHEFNNLLTVISGNLELLREEAKPDDSEAELLQSIAEAASRAGSITSQLLAFSRRNAATIRDVDLNQLVRESVRLLNPILPRGIRLRTELTDAPAVIRADAGQISQALINLAVNARDAMPHGGELKLSTARVNGVGTASGSLLADTWAGARGFVTLRVSDNGNGMDEATRNRLFEPFFTTKEVGKGTGLGLAMVYGTVKQVGGHIEVTSAPGAGTTFTLYFPEREQLSA